MGRRAGRGRIGHGEQRKRDADERKVEATLIATFTRAAAPEEEHSGAGRSGSATGAIIR